MNSNDIEKLIASGTEPTWARPKDPERIAALLRVMDTRQLTETEAQELYDASDGVPAPTEVQARLIAGVTAKIKEEEGEHVILRRMLEDALHPTNGEEIAGEDLASPRNEVENGWNGGQCPTTESRPNFDSPPLSTECEEQAKGILDRARDLVESHLLELEVAVVSLSNWLIEGGLQASPVLAGVKQDNMLGPEEITQTTGSVAVISLASIDKKQQLRKVPWVGAMVRIAQVPNASDPNAALYACAVDVVRSASSQEGALHITLVGRTSEMQEEPIAEVELTARERTRTFSMVGRKPTYLALGNLKVKIALLERVQP